MRYFQMAALTIVLAAQHCSAQTPGAPPRRPPYPPPGALRLERLRDFGLRAFEAIRPLAETAAVAPLDANELNTAFHELFSVFVATDPAIESFNVAFDTAKTDLAQDRLAIQADARFKRTTWYAGPTHVKVDVETRLDNSRPIPRATLDGHVTIDTEVLSMVNHLLPILERRLAAAAESETRAPAPNAHPATPEDAALREYALTRLGQVDQVGSMDELADLIVQLASRRFTAKVDEIERLRGELRTSAPSADLANLEGQLQAARVERDQLLTIRPLVERDDAGQAVAVRMTIPAIDTGRAVGARDVELVITRERVAVSGLVGMDDEQNLLALARPMILSTLGGIQNADAQTRETQRRVLEGMLAPWRAWLFGEAP